MSFWLAASFGDFPLRCTSIRTEDGRDIVVQSPSRGSKHFLQDRGAKIGRVDAEIVFVDEPGSPLGFRERFDAFRDLIADGTPSVFTHPLLGSYVAVCEGGQHTIDARRMITWSVAFLPEEEPETTSQVLAGVTPLAGVQSVEVFAQGADDELEAVGLASDAPTSALDTVTAWNEADDLDSQDVIVGVESLAAKIDDAIETLELATVPERWDAYRAMVNLSYAVRRAADALTSTSAQVVPLTVDAAEPMLSICARVYGADRAVEMSEVVTKRNRVRTPGLVPRGTVLAMPGV